MNRNRGWITVKENRDAWRAILRQIHALKHQKPASLTLIRGRKGSGKTRLIEEGLSRLLDECPGASYRVLEPADLERALKSPHSEWYQGKELARLDWLILENLEPMESSREDRLCNLLDQRNRAGLPVLITTKQPWNALSQSPRLSNRLRGGVCLALEPWSLPSRRKWLEKLMLESGVPVKPTLIQTWCKETDPWPASMEKSVQVLFSRAAKSRGKCGSARPEKGEPGDGKELARQRCLASVSRVFGVTLKQLEGKSREKSIVLARCAAVGLLRETHQSTLQRIGSLLGHRDHSTILHALERYRKLKRSDTEFNQLLKSAQDLI